MAIKMDPRLMVADVKCYFCGHVSGQILGRKGEPLRVTDFIPRPGYTGQKPASGQRLRCERCHGPVFLEDAGPAAVTDLLAAMARKKATVEIKDDEEEAA